MGINDANDDAEANTNAYNTAGSQMQEDIQGAIEELKLVEGGNGINESEDSPPYHFNSDLRLSQWAQFMNDD